MRKCWIKRFVVIGCSLVLILGTGGTSKTAYAVLSDLGARQILKASIIDEPGTITYEEANTIHNDVDIIINTTPVGMYPNIDCSVVDREIIKKFEVAIDLIYNPIQTKFLKLAYQEGKITVGGLHMLIGQAVKSQAIFNDKDIDNDLINYIYDNIKDIF